MISRLERLYRRKVSAESLFSYDLAEELCDCAIAMRRDITVLLDQRGRLQHVAVGVESHLEQILELKPPEPEAGLSDFYCFRTHLGWCDFSQPEMSLPDQVTVLQYHLPIMGVLIAGTQKAFSRQRGESPHFCDAVFLLHPTTSTTPEESMACEVEPPMVAHQLEAESLEKWIDWGKEVFSPQRSKKTTSQAHGKERALLIGVDITTKHETYKTGTRLDIEDSMGELRLLAETAGAQVVGQMIQSRKQPDSTTYIGKGKAQALALEIQQNQAQVVIADDELSPAQQRTLEKILRVKVIDRTEVILDIFAQRAHSREGKIQVALAQLSYLLPRLMGRGRMFSQQTAVGAKAGIATRGPGETQLETDRRVLKKRVAHLEQEAKAVVQHRQRQRRQRQQTDVPLITLVGYTNAGKSTLMHRLTQANILVEDKLFATLDPTIRRLYLPTGRETLLSDTVGFIQKLPTFLVKAFQSTLEEVSEADILLHVWDVSHPSRLAHWHAVEETLCELGISDVPVVTVCNKVDRLKNKARELQSLEPLFSNSDKDWAAISATTGEGVDDLLAVIAQLCDEMALNPITKYQ